KYRLALVASHVNGCCYCTSHHACTLQRRWGYQDQQLVETLDPQGPRDEREEVAMEFVRQASADAAAVTDELRARLAGHFTPQEVNPVKGYTDWVNYEKRPGEI